MKKSLVNRSHYNLIMSIIPIRGDKHAETKFRYDVGNFYKNWFA